MVYMVNSWILISIYTMVVRFSYYQSGRCNHKTDKIKRYLELEEYIFAKI
jgi:hypothetical protein